MRIKKVTVESFGKLKNKNIEFSDGINVIKGENESGKSTLSRFIRFMLYGFTSRNTDINKNDKKKYLPWDGSNCKGSMEVVTENGSYTVRREKAARASHSVTDESGVPVFKGENAGNVLLGVDEDTYDKTALISAGDVYFDDAVSLSSAIKNMVFAADSSIDSEAAVKKLEALKKSILGKTERSGRLYDARLEMSELTMRKNELAEAHKELLGAEAMLDKIKGNIERNNYAIDALQKERHNLEAYDARQRLEKINGLKTKADASKKLYEDKSAELTVDGFLPDRNYLSAVNESILSLRALEGVLEQAKKEYEYSEQILKECYRDEKQLAFNNKLNDAGRTADELKSDVSTLKGKLKSKKTIAVILTVLIVTIPIALIFWAGCSKIKKQLAKLCEMLGCADIAELERLLANSESANALARTAKTKLEQARKNLDDAYDKRESTASELSSMLEKSGVAALFSDTSELALIAKEQVKRISTSIDGLESLEIAMNIDITAYQSFMDTVGDFDALVALADSFDESMPLRDSAKNAKELDFYVRATEGLRVQERDYEKKAAVISSNMDKPDELAAKISLLEKEIDELEKKHAALAMAQDAIENAHASMRGNVSPILTRKASELFSMMTEGKYKGLYVDNDLQLSVLEEGSAEYRSIDYLSSGASDAAYLALRITLTEYLYEENPVLIFDDAFSRLDDNRLKKVCEMLKSLATKYQIIILTCHDREGEFLKTEAQTSFGK